MQFRTSRSRRNDATWRRGARICCPTSATTSCARSRRWSWRTCVRDTTNRTSALPTQRKALMLLQGILRRAVVRGLIPSNPVQAVNKPRQAPPRRPQPLPPLTIERIRAQVSKREPRSFRRRGGKRPRREYEAQSDLRATQRDTLIASLAYAGLRPTSDPGRWRDLGEKSLHVHASKTERPRTVKLLAPLAQDLAEWRLASGRPERRRAHLSDARRRRLEASGLAELAPSDLPAPPQAAASRETSACIAFAARSCRFFYGRDGA